MRLDRPSPRTIGEWGWALSFTGTSADKFTSYNDAAEWLQSIGGHVGLLAQISPDLDGVTVFGPSGLSRLGSFPTDPMGAHYQSAYENAVRVACGELYEDLKETVGTAK